MHVTIDAAPHREVRIQRREIGVEGIIKFDSDDVVRADIDVWSNVKDEGRKTALMFAEINPVDPNAGVRERAVEFQEEVESDITVAHRVMSSIPADAPVVIAGGIALSVGDIPGVRQV